MTTRGQRDLRILQMRETGATYRDLAAMFGLSQARIGAIVQRLEAERSMERERAKLLERIRRTDDLDKKWPTADLVDALRPLAVTRTALVKRVWKETNRVSLRDLMDLTIPGTMDPTAGYLTTPLLDVPCIGERGFWSVVNRLTDLDLGKRSNEYWRIKLTRLTRCRRIRRTSPHAWSKPCRLPRIE